MALTAKNLHGAFPALATPFLADGSKVDYDSLANLVDVQIAGGVDGLVVCGSTAEAATLEFDEYRAVLQFVSDRIKGGKPIIAGIGTSSTKQAQAFAQVHRELKVDAILISTPPYNKPPQQGVIEHFRQIKTASAGIPLIAYNIPGRAGLNLTTSTVKAMVTEGLVIGLKEASGNFEQVLDVIAACQPFIKDGKMAILSGEDSYAHALIASGGQGIISASQNVAPKQFSDLVHAHYNGKPEQARDIQLELLPLVHAMFMETNPIPVKVGLALQGVIKSPAVRLPLIAAEPATVERIKQVLAL